MNTANIDPRIGTLANGQFYAFANGYDQAETRGTLEQVEIALGLRAAAVVVKAAAKKVRRYIVKMTHAAYYAGGARMDGAEVEIDAATSAQAISEARRRYREAEGRERMPATFSARIAD